MDLLACQAPLSMGFCRQEYWSGLPFPSPGALPDPGIEHVSSAWQMDSLPLNHQGNPWNTRDVQKLRRQSEILVVAPPHYRRYPYHFFPGVHLCLASILTKQFLCLLSHLLCYVSKNKLHTFIYNFCHIEKCTFYWGYIYASNLHLSCQFLNYGVMIYTFLCLFNQILGSQRSGSRPNISIIVLAQRWVLDIGSWKSNPEIVGFYHRGFLEPLSESPGNQLNSWIFGRETQECSF